MGEDALHVGLGRRIGRDAPVALDGIFTSVVGGKCELTIAVELVEQRAQVGHTAAHVLHRIPDVGDAEALRCSGDELHETALILGGVRIGVEVGFDFDQREHELRIELIARCEVLDEIVDIGAGEFADLDTCSDSGVIGTEPEAGIGTETGTVAGGADGGASAQVGLWWQAAFDQCVGEQTVRWLGKGAIERVELTQAGFGLAVADGVGGLEPGCGQHFVDGAEAATGIEPAEMEAGARLTEISSVAVILEGTVEVLRHADTMLVALALVDKPVCPLAIVVIRACRYRASKQA